MWDVYIDGQLAHSSTVPDVPYSDGNKPSQCVSAVLKLTKGAAGTLTVKLTPDHVLYDTIEPLVNRWDVCLNGELLWSGRTYEIEIDIDANKTVTVEGLLACLNDAILQPYSGAEQVIYDEQLSDMAQEVLEKYNDTARWQIKHGTVGTTSTETLYRAYENYETVYDRLEDIAESLETNMQIRTENGVDYLDWLTDDDLACNTDYAIDLGDNLLDITETTSAADIITGLIPTGDDITEGEVTHPLTVESVNGGSPIIWTEDAAVLEKYGRIVATKSWSDVTTAGQLLSKGRAYIELKSKSYVTFEVSAILTQRDIWRIGDEVAVTSRPHNLSKERMMCTATSINLLDPSANTVTLSSTRAGLAGINRASDRQIINKLYTLNQSVYNVANEAAKNYYALAESAIEQTAESIRLYCAQWLTDDELSSCGGDISAMMEMTAGKIRTELGSLWIEETEDGITIGRSGSTVQSVQDNESYAFEDTATGDTILKMDTTGLTAPTVKSAKEITLMDGDAKQWSIRQGAANSTGIGWSLVWVG